MTNDASELKRNARMTPFAAGFRGAHAALQGFGFARSHQDVRRACLAAVALYLLVWLAIMALAAHFDAQVAARLLGDPAPGGWQRALWYVMDVGFYLLWWLMALLLAVTLALPVLTPLCTIVANRTEQRYFGAEARPMAHGLLTELVRGLGRAVLLGSLQLGGTLLLWVAGMALGAGVPLVGAPLAFGLGAVWNALWLAVVLAGFTLDEHDTPWRQQLAMVRRNMAVWLGFGLVANMLAWLPFTMPYLVVAATLQLCRLHESGRVVLQRRLPSVDS
jgi:uncharacterized protein involved in cysteine biosynthesis